MGSLPSASPFPDLVNAEVPVPAAVAAATTETPFLAEYRLGDETIDLAAGAQHAFFAELFDAEFDEALDNLLNEAEAEYERLGTDETPAGNAQAERRLERWIEPLRSEAEEMFERMASGLDAVRADTLDDGELDELFARYEPQETDLPPAFEDFLGKLWKKAKGAVKGAVKLAKKGIATVSKLMPLGLILRKLAKLVRPLLQRVVTMAVDKLPPALRPYAATLAKKFTGEQETSAEATISTPATTDVHALQLGFDAEVTSLYFAPDEFSQEEMLAEAAAAATTRSDALGDLDEARAQFLRRFEELEAGEDPTPVVEEFLPALLPALRIGIKMAGRPKVVSFLARYLGRLIAPYVGPQVTPALSQAIVDAGLRLMTLETPAGQVPDVAGEAFANVVEDTVRRVKELIGDELQDELDLEMAAYLGFQEAVAANFPAGLLDPASEHLETAQPLGTWVSMPRGHRVRYRKFSRVLPVTISPQTAKAVRTFGGRALTTFLRDQTGRSGVVEGRLHLYQAVPGSRIGQIMRAERRLSGLGAGVLHPLTREAAGMLLHEPGLGREVDEAYLDQPEPLAVGERLYYLEVPRTGSATRRPSAGRLTVDLVANEIRVELRLAESDCQAIAVRLRRKEPLGASLAALRRIYGDTIRAALAKPHRIRVVRDDMEAPGAGLLRLAPSPSLVLERAISRWVGQALGVELARQRDAFVSATTADADGVTLLVRLSEPPGLRSIAALVKGGRRNREHARFRGGAPETGSRAAAGEPGDQTGTPRCLRTRPHCAYRSPARSRIGGQPSWRWTTSRTSRRPRRGPVWSTTSTWRSARSCNSPCCGCSAVPTCSRPS